MILRCHIALLCAVALFPATADELENVTPLLVGTYINRVESRLVDIFEDEGRYWLALPDVAELTGIRTEAVKQGFKIRTPLGNVTIPQADLMTYQGEYYLSDALLKEKLHAEFAFIPSEYAIALQIPWQPGAPLADEAPQKKAAVKIRPDIKAPSGSLSYIRSEFAYNYNFSSRSADWNSAVETGGRGLSGIWAVRGTYRDTGQLRLERYY